ncbi:MAG: hypothetical protein M9932_09945 [Xanthobacteraceae bacterium]|nr:hypothetical protein [Xanthobacteraceae bacterium]
MDIHPLRRKQKEKHQFAAIPNFRPRRSDVGLKLIGPQAEPRFAAARPIARRTVKMPKAGLASGHLMAGFGGRVH